MQIIIGAVTETLRESLCTAVAESQLPDCEVVHCGALSEDCARLWLGLRPDVEQAQDRVVEQEKSCGPVLLNTLAMLGASFPAWERLDIQVLDDDLEAWFDLDTRLLRTDDGVCLLVFQQAKPVVVRVPPKLIRSMHMEAACS